MRVRSVVFVKERRQREHNIQWASLHCLVFHCVGTRLRKYVCDAVCQSFPCRLNDGVKSNCGTTIKKCLEAFGAREPDNDEGKKTPHQGKKKLLCECPVPPTAEQSNI